MPRLDSTLWYDWLKDPGVDEAFAAELGVALTFRQRLITSVEIDGVIQDTHNPSREVHTIESDHGQTLKPGQWRNVNGICSIQRRCVYGYFIEA